MDAKSFFILKEKEVPLEEQISSIFIGYKWNSKKLFSKIIQMNKVKTFDELRKKIKIIIPSPLGQKKCNFVRVQSGLVSFKRHIKSSEQRIEFLKNNKAQCNYYDVHQNYIRRTSGTPVSTIIYSLFLKDIWKPKGVMSQISRINGIQDMDEYKTRTIFIIPPIAYSTGCNYMEYPSGKIRPLVLINKKVEREELAVAFKCVGARDFPVAEEPAPEPEPEKKEPPKPKHHLSVLAGTTIHYDQSAVSDVTVEIISGYSVISRYWYDWSEDERININGNFENYLGVKNRGLKNNNLWRKNINYEKLYKPTLGYTIGLYEDWYFDNIEVDDFQFTSSVLTYAGLTYHNTHWDKYQFDLELGLITPLDLLAKERYKGGVFSHNYLTFPFKNYKVVLGAAFDFNSYERHTSQNYSFQAGLRFDY